MSQILLWLVGLVTKSSVTLATPWTVAGQAPLSMGFSRQEYWSGLTDHWRRGVPGPERLGVGRACMYIEIAKIRM